jgi:xyloglucan-specific exo-beta-1,4-glucanase
MKMNRVVIGVILLCAGLLCAQDEYAWDNVVIGGGGFVSAVIPSHLEQNVFYARTDVGGAYRWNEQHQMWVSMMDWVNADERGLLGIEALAIDPQTPGTVYMMAGTIYWNQAEDNIGRSAFLRSQDYGATWEKIYTWDNSTKWFNVHGNGMGRGTGEALAVDPKDSDVLFYGTRNNGLWKSENNGNTWQKVSSFPVDTTWNGAGFSFVAFDANSGGSTYTNTIYAGLLREGDNVFVSEDGGNTWSVLQGRPTEQYAPRLMPQRIAITPDRLYITFGDGAGPHTMQWDEGWGPINDWFNRGAVYLYNRTAATWTNISPQNLIDPEGDGDFTDPSTYYGAYSGLSIDPNNPDLVVVSSTASYRGTQYWKIGSAWQDKWGDNIFVSEDGGNTWAPSFQYYWLEGGSEPPGEQMDENGFPWIVGNTIHWIGSVAIDPFKPQRVFVTSGNGIYQTDNILDYSFGEPDWSGVAPLSQKTVWKFAGKGVEEVVPTDVISIPGGPLVSVILDYDGFVHNDITVPAPLGRHKTNVGGEDVSLGSTTGLAYAPLSGKLAKVAKSRVVELQYNDIPIGPVQYSLDSGKTWSAETYTSEPPDSLSGGKVALSADGEVTLWMPDNASTMYRHANSAWTQVSGISFWARPIADAINPTTFYAFNRTEGFAYKSTNGGESFTKAGEIGQSNFGTLQTAPGQEGDIWAPVALVSQDGVRSGALMRSTDGANSFTAVPGVGYCEAVGFGKAHPDAEYPAVYIFAEVDGVLGVFQSIDEGASWVRVNDDAHEYGGLANGEFVKGDMNTFGVVYMSTAGRGIAARMPASWTENIVSVHNPIQRVNHSAVHKPLVTSDMHNKQLRVYNLQGELVYSKRLQQGEALPVFKKNWFTTIGE